MMALGGYLPGLDPTSYLSYMYSGLPGFFPGMTAMPLLQPGLLPGQYTFTVVSLAVSYTHLTLPTNIAV